MVEFGTSSTLRDWVRVRVLVDGLRTSTTLCSRSRCGAREAMTVGCKPTRVLGYSSGVRGRKV